LKNYNINELKELCINDELDINKDNDYIDDESLLEETNKSYNTSSLSALKQFFKEIGEYKLLTKEREFEIASLIQEIEKEKIEYENKVKSNEEITIEYKNYIDKRIALENNLRNELINANYRLVVSVAKNYQNNNMDFMDLVEEGILGLIKATYGYDPSTGNRFSTYAVNWIKQSISRSILNNSKMIRIPIHIVETMNKINQAELKFIEDNERTPTIKELSEILGLKEKKIIEVKNSFYSVKYLDEKTSYDNDLTLEETISDKESLNPENINDENDLKTEIDKVLKTLTEKEEIVIKYRYGLNGKEKTLEEIGKELRLTKERVRQIEQNALRKLRKPERIKELMCFV